MKICWDNINQLRYNINTDKWYKDRYDGSGKVIGTNSYELNEVGCTVCGEPFFFATGNKNKCCSLSCNTRYRNSIIKMSSETKKKISISKTGKKMPKEVRERIKFRPQNQRWKGKANPVYDVKLKNKRRQTVISKGIYKGKNNPRWKGGCQNILGYGWDFNNDLKRRIKERDNYQCQNPFCKRISKRIEVHHIDYNKENNDQDNLITLCHSCNNMANFNRKNHMFFYRELLKKKVNHICQ